MREESKTSAEVLKEMLPIYQELYQLADPDGEIAVHIEYETAAEAAPQYDMCLLENVAALASGISIGEVYAYSNSGIAGCYGLYIQWAQAFSESVDDMVLNEEVNWYDAMESYIDSIKAHLENQRSLPTDEDVSFFIHNAVEDGGYFD